MTAEEALARYRQDLPYFLNKVTGRLDISKLRGNILCAGARSERHVMLTSYWRSQTGASSCARISRNGAPRPSDRHRRCFFNPDCADPRACLKVWAHGKTLLAALEQLGWTISNQVYFQLG